MMKEETKNELNSFIEDWKEDAGGNKDVFLYFRKYLSEKDNVVLDFIAREGITYSLRAKHINQKKRDLFVMVDVIEDASRWLSICFYNEMILDVDEKGDFVPGGLLGEDAVCFDLEDQDEDLIKYIEARLDEAYVNAASE